VIDLKMISDHPGKTESGKSIPVGTTVEYLGHVAGGMVRVRLPDGAVEVMHPHCFKKLRV
jgi:hypothetical protein